MNRHCLICYSELLQETAPVKKKGRPNPRSGQPTSGQQEDTVCDTGTGFVEAARKNGRTEATDSLVSRQAQVIFILRNVLEIPSRLLEGFLQKWDTVTPETWVRVCDHCSGVVKEAQLLFEELMTAKRTFWKAQLGIVNRVLETSRGRRQSGGNKIKGSRKGRERKCAIFKEDDHVVEITDDCRDFVATHTYESLLYYKSNVSAPPTESYFRTPGVGTDAGPEESSKPNNFPVEFVHPSVKIEPVDDPNCEEKTECAIQVEDERPSALNDPLHTFSDIGKDDIDGASKPSRRRRRKASPTKDAKGALGKERKPTPVKRKRANKGQQCDMCHEFVPLPELLDHVRAHVGDDYLVKCPNSEKGCLFVCCQARGLNYHLVRNTSCRESIPEKERKQYMHPDHICDICGYNPTSIVALRHHIDRTHENNHTKIYPCPIPHCTQQFTVQQSVRLHIPIHREKSALHAFGIQACVQCEEKVKLDNMEVHLRDVHEALEIVRCPQCPSLFSSQELLIDHLYAHRYEGLFCHLCSDEGQTKFSQHVKLRQHYFKVHNIGKEFRCEVCPMATFLSEFHLHQHNLRHGLRVKEGDAKPCPNPLIRKRDMTHSCDECEKTFKSTYSLESHKIRMHGAEPYRCKHCADTFFTVSHRNRHEQEQHEGILLPEKEFRCKIAGCGATFKKRRPLKQHLIDAHDADDPFVCELCDKSFMDQSNLTSHVNAVHLGLRPWVCDTCGEGFKEEYVLRNHVLIHTGERPYVCELCGQRFRQKEVLRRHVQAHEERGSHFKPRGSMQQIRKRVGVHQ